MKRTNLLISAAIGCILFLVYGCRKDFYGIESDLSDISVTEASWAKLHYNQLIKKEGREVKRNGEVQMLPNNKPNLKHTIWKKAYYSETDKAFFVEIPVLYNQRSSMVKSKTKLTVEEQQEVFRGSFDRLVIYKDKKTGNIGQKLLTYIPDLMYLRKHNKDISHNQINKMDKDFEGYLLYRSWSGTNLYLLEVSQGKTTARINFLKKRAGALNYDGN